MSELDKLYGYLFDVNTYIERMTGVEGYESPVAKLIEVRDSVLKFISKIEEKDPMFFAGDGSNYTNKCGEMNGFEQHTPKSTNEWHERIKELEPPVDPEVSFSTEDDGFLFDLSPDDEEYPFIQEQD